MTHQRRHNSMAIVIKTTRVSLISLAVCSLLINCGGGSSNGTLTNTPTDNPGDNVAIEQPNGDNQQEQPQAPEEPQEPTQPQQPEQEPSQLDVQLSTIIDGFDWNTDPLANRDLPSINSPLAQLGKKLFFSKSLGGNFDTACASCHHPSLGGADALSLPIGVHAQNLDLLGPGRIHNNGLPLVPRNSPTNFNIGLWDSGMFFDSRVESVGKEQGANGSLSDITTPDSGFGRVDDNAGANLVAAQAKFPVTSSEEMKTDDFENGSDNDTIRAHLAARLGDYGVGAGELARNEWLAEFQEAYQSSGTAAELITFNNIADALGEYQRSLVFVDNPWQNYVDGDLDALTEEQKLGAQLFFTAVNDGGAGCVNCHKGTLFSDEQHHTIAAPGFGPGKGDGNNDDFGRERETGNTDDRYRYRTPTLLNIARTGPYMHTGAYESLREVVMHYVNPNNAVNDFFNDGGWCDLAQYNNVANCASLYPFAQQNSQAALQKLNDERDRGISDFQSPRLNRNEVDQLVSFLEALTDPCIDNRTCLEDWIADENLDNPDDQILIAVDRNGTRL